MFHKVLQVVPTDDYKVYIYFDDGKIKLFDASELIKKGVFQQLQGVELFKNSCTVLNDTLAWDLSGKFDPYNCLDLDPEELYNSCPEVKEPIKI
ncbi:MAG: DUF2442 domain-containing protein [Desulfitobacteriaceae bacterium]|nr:DUF2442 domain-containing protein [Desulfitobacteriaceae bacterium]